jgi:hypothetical protein
MFCRATHFNQSLAGWDDSSVRDRGSMFAHAVSFNKSLDGWDTRCVKPMNCIFYNAKQFNQTLDHFNHSSVTYLTSMCKYASSFNQSLEKCDCNHIDSCNIHSMLCCMSSSSCKKRLPKGLSHEIAMQG